MLSTNIDVTDVIDMWMEGWTRHYQARTFLGSKNPSQQSIFSLLCQLLKASIIIKHIVERKKKNQARSKRRENLIPSYELTTKQAKQREIEIMFRTIAIILLAASAIMAFQPMTTTRPSFTTTTPTKLHMSDLFGEYDLDMEVGPPPDECNVVDVQRAQECIMNPEGCTVEEIQSLKKGT